MENDELIDAKRSNTEEPKMGEEGMQSIKEEMEKITTANQEDENIIDTEEEGEDIPETEQENEESEEDIFFEEEEEEEGKMELEGVDEFRKMKLAKSEGKYITEKNTEKMIQRMMTPLLRDMRMIRTFYETDRLKVKSQINEMKRYVDKISEIEREREALKKKEVINFSDFSIEEMAGLKNIFNEKLRSYESRMRDVSLLSDHPLEKAKVFRMAWKIMNSTLSILDENSLSYIKIEKLLKPTYEFYADLENRYQRYETDYILADSLIEQLGEIIIENHFAINRIVDVFLNIVQRTETINYDGTVGLKITSEESANIYKEIVGNFK